MLQELRGRGVTEGKVRISPEEVAVAGRNKRKIRICPTVAIGSEQKEEK